MAFTLDWFHTTGCFTSVIPWHPLSLGTPSSSPWVHGPAPQAFPAVLVPNTLPSAPHAAKATIKPGAPALSNSFIHRSSGHSISTMLGINTNKPKEQCPTKGQIHICSSFPTVNNAALTKTAGFFTFVCFLTISAHSPQPAPMLSPRDFCLWNPQAFLPRTRSPSPTMHMPWQEEEFKPSNYPCLKIKENKCDLTKVNAFL